MIIKIRLLHKSKLLITLSLIVLIIVLILIEKRSYSTFDERAWYEDEYVSNKMLPDIHLDVDEILGLQKHIDEINKAQEIYNKDALQVANTTIIIVVQVHDSSFYLEHLLQSLYNVKGITKCLIIFSHDRFENETALLVQNTYFARYMQIFYPYNIQMHPHVFPGQDLKYCVKNMINCDINVKGRDPEKAQLKHHWWWTVSTVFDKLEATKNYDGSILFLEEDNFVTEDLLYVIKMVEKLLPQICPDCDMMALGRKYPSIKDYRPNETRLVLEPWGLRENMGIIFNRTLWNELKMFDQNFCRHNDYSWRNSLTHISKYMKKGKLYIASVKSARVFRFESCPYSDDVYCHEVEKVISVQKFEQEVKKFMYPIVVSYTNKTGKSPRFKPLGGWKDTRDHELCIFYTSKINI